MTQESEAEAGSDIGRLWRWLGRNGNTLSGLLGIMSGVPLAFDASRPIGVLLILAAAAIFLGYVLGRRKLTDEVRKRVTQVTDNFSTYVDIVSVLHGLAKDMGLQPPWRLSLYVENGGSWERLSRTSNYPPYAASGRRQLPLDQGVLGWALKFGGENELPELPDPETEFEEYLRFQAGRNVDADATRNLGMRSRSYVAITFPGDSPASGYKALGVVAESEVPRGTDIVRIRRIATRDVVHLLYSLNVVRISLSGLHGRVLDAIQPD